MTGKFFSALVLFLFINDIFLAATSRLLYMLLRWCQNGRGTKQRGGKFLFLSHSFYFTNYDF
jgi:hypothetical protein